MARKLSAVTITSEGRDKGKQFLLTEMPATRAEKWALRVFLALAKSGVEVPDDVASMGMAGIAMIGLRSLSGVSFDLAEPLLDEMMTCVQVVPDATRPEIVRKLVESDTEEITTIFKLRQEVLALHVDFSSLAARLNSGASQAAQAET
jgi:hypothetical protein